MLPASARNLDLTLNTCHCSPREQLIAMAVVSVVVVFFLTRYEAALSSTVCPNYCSTRCRSLVLQPTLGIS